MTVPRRRYNYQPDNTERCSLVRHTTHRDPRRGFTPAQTIPAGFTGVQDRGKHTPPGNTVLARPAVGAATCPRPGLTGHAQGFGVTRQDQSVLILQTQTYRVEGN